MSRSLSLSPSYLLAAVIVGAHLCAAATVLVALPGWPGALLAAALAALGLASAWSRALLRAKRSARAIELSDGRASARLTDGDSVAAQAAGHVSRYAVPLRLADGPRRALLLTADMTDRESFRALRVWALWGKLPGVAAKQLAS